jgi:hypothetical protein
MRVLTKQPQPQSACYCGRQPSRQCQRWWKSHQGPNRLPITIKRALIGVSLSHEGLSILGWRVQQPYARSKSPAAIQGQAKQPKGGIKWRIWATIYPRSRCGHCSYRLYSSGSSRFYCICPIKSTRSNQCDACSAGCQWASTRQEEEDTPHLSCCSTREGQQKGREEEEIWCM